jgi:hypothetical protein
VAGIAVVEIVAPVAVAVAVAAAAVLAAARGVAAEALFPAYFFAANMCLDNYIVHSEGAPEFAVAVELGSEVASGFASEVEIGLGPEPEPEAMTADFESAEVVAVVSVAEDEVFG